MASPRVKFVNNYLNIYRIRGENMTLNHHDIVTNKIAVYQLNYEMLDSVSKDLFFSGRTDNLIMENMHLHDARKEFVG